jgi:hypothetical protein
VVWFVGWEGVRGAMKLIVCSKGFNAVDGEEVVEPSIVGTMSNKKVSPETKLKKLVRRFIVFDVNILDSVRAYPSTVTEA